MPAVSPAQQRLFGMVSAEQKGELGRPASPEVKRLARTMTHQQVHDFAATKGLAFGGLPKAVKLDTSVIPRGPKTPGFTATSRPPKPIGLSPSTWSEKSEARGLMRGAAFQMGGDSSSWMEHQAYDNEIQMPHGGFLDSSIAGRTDRLPVATAVNSFVIPAAEVSGLGQGNTLSGPRLLQLALRTGPYGTELPRSSHAHTIPRPPTLPGGARAASEGESHGGRAEAGDGDSHVLVAGGEMVIPPHDWVARDPEDNKLYWHRGVQSVGEGDVNKGQERLRQMVMNIRKHTIKTLNGMPEPKS